MIVLVLERCGGVMLSLLVSVGWIDFGDLAGIAFARFFRSLGLCVFVVLIRDIIAMANLVRKEGFSTNLLFRAILVQFLASVANPVAIW